MGARIAITSVAGGVQLYDVATGQQIGTPMVSDGFGVGADPTLGGYGVAWSADGRGVWAVSLEGPVRYAAYPDSWPRHRMAALPDANSPPRSGERTSPTASPR